MVNSALQDLQSKESTTTHQLQIELTAAQNKIESLERQIQSLEKQIADSKELLSPCWPNDDPPWADE